MKEGTVEERRAKEEKGLLCVGCLCVYSNLFEMCTRLKP